MTIENVSLMKKSTLVLIQITEIESNGIFVLAAVNHLATSRFYIHFN